MKVKKEDIKSGNIIDTNVLKRLYQFVKPYNRRFYFLVFLTLALAVLAPLRPFVIQKAIDQPIAQNDFQGLVSMTFILVGLLIMQAIVQYGHTYISGWLGQYIIRDIRLKLYRHLLSLRLKFFDKTPIGRLVTRNVSDVETLSDVFSQGLAGMIGDILQILFILIMMFAMSWKLTLVSLATLPLLFLSTYIFKEKVKVAFNEVRNAVSNLNSFVQEHVTGMAIVQIFTAEKREYEAFKKINNEHKKANIRSVLYYSVYFPVAEVIQATGIGLLVWYGSKGVINQAESGITLGMLIAFILYIQMFFRPIRLIADRFNTLQMGIVSSSRILNLLDNKEYIPNNGSYKPHEVHGDVSFKNVHFAYNEDEKVLKNISFEVKRGETVALVGATGAGKSSVINLLSRFYDIQTGNISLDGVDIKEYDLDHLRSNIGVVLQDVFLFSDTILYNITLGNPNISLQQVKEAAEMVGARKFIERLPDAYHYNVMERGATLSVGQRQLISFVRAMVYNPKIIVLDEATSSVDTETEEMIQSAIEKMMKGRTSIVIAHRLSTIKKANKIMVMDKGEIKEVGTHDQLLAKEGFYTQLYNMQYKEVSG
ncbi:ABC transporter ATP-binding protein [Marivirga sp. S37H4]|uniref:ABC transporter ATP-binding protein n=1 Tax=Marivirga aurantiaca TaxID=2802615 RepID=A0A935C904_9BACT|nr:ABC transporter ATP-binding protein [Marivirga aurantiaca]MBK6265901.1 ABC transporter ATP-binding protein [Marivirga aurantiaca]